MFVITSKGLSKRGHHVNKFGMTSNICQMFVMKSKIRHDVKHFVIKLKTRHDVKKFVMTSKSQKIRHDIKNTP